MQGAMGTEMFVVVEKSILCQVPGKEALLYVLSTYVLTLEPVHVTRKSSIGQAS